MLAYLQEIRLQRTPENMIVVFVGHMHMIKELN